MTEYKEHLKRINEDYKKKIDKINRETYLGFTILLLILIAIGLL